MVAVALRHTASFATSRSYSVQSTSIQIACKESDHRVGEYIADYSELSAGDIAAPHAEMDELLARSKVVSVKRGL